MKNPTQYSRDLLTEAEKALVASVVNGEVLHVARHTSGSHAVKEGPRLSPVSPGTIRAAVIRDILRGRLAPDPDPHGVRLHDARISGTLDLEHLISTVPINLTSCQMPEGIVLSDANLPSLILTNCQLGHPYQSALLAERLTANYVALIASTIIANCADGAVSLIGARLGAFNAWAATLANDSGPALDADGSTIDHEFYLRGGFKATGSGENGAVRLRGAHISGQLDCTDASIANSTGPALNAEGIIVDQPVFLGGNFTATGNGELGAVRFLGAHIYSLEADGATLINRDGTALHADGLSVEHDVYLWNKFAAIGSGKGGAIRLTGGHIGGQLSFANARLTNKSGPALHAQGLTVDAAVFLTGTFTAVGRGELGTIRFLSAHLYQLEADGATLTNESGSAIQADALLVDRAIILRAGFRAVGSSDEGAVRLSGGHIGIQLDCTGATLENKKGPALEADGLVVEQDVFFRHGFNAVGGNEDGAIRIRGSHIGGQLDCRDATLMNDKGPALDARGLTVNQDVLFIDGFIARGAGTGAVIDLSQMRVNGVLTFDPLKLEHATNPYARLDVDGLTYTGLPARITPQAWLRLIREGTPSYTAQPYQYLAAVLAAAGDDGDARDVLIAQRQDQIRRHALTGLGERAWAKFTGLMLGYGYKPSRALFYLLGVVIVSIGLALVLGTHGGLAQTILAKEHSTTCTALQDVAVGLNLGTPLFSTNTQCNPTNTATGDILTITSWVLRVVAWALATLFIAGFTGAVRKT